MRRVLCFFLFVPSLSWAQFEKPTFRRVSGETVTASFDADRVAELRFSRGSEFIADVPFEISENACADTGVGQELLHRVPVRVDKLGWFWQKHVDPAKVGQPLKFRPPGTQPLVSFAIVTNQFRSTYPDLVLNIARETLTFTSRDWLPGLEGGLKDFLIPYWSAELMLPNGQSGIVENRVSGEATNLHLTKTSEDTVTISSIDSTVSYGTTGESFALLGSVITWEWLRPNGESCTIAFKPNTAELNRKVSVALLYSGNETFLPYLYQQDSLEKAVFQFITDENVSYAE